MYPVLPLHKHTVWKNCFFCRKIQKRKIITATCLEANVFTVNVWCYRMLNTNFANFKSMHDFTTLYTAPHRHTTILCHFFLLSLYTFILHAAKRPCNHMWWICRCYYKLNVCWPCRRVVIIHKILSRLHASERGAWNSCFGANKTLKKTCPSTLCKLTSNIIHSA